METEWNRVVWKSRTPGRHHELTFRNGKWLNGCILRNMNFSDGTDCLNHKFVHLLGNQAHVHAHSSFISFNKAWIKKWRRCHCWIMCSLKLSNLISALTERALKKRKITKKSPPEWGKPLFLFFITEEHSSRHAWSIPAAFWVVHREQSIFTIWNTVYGHVFKERFFFKDDIFRS